MKPPSGGPMTGPINAGTVNQAKAPTSSDFLTLRRITIRPTGTIMAPPIPWTTRAATSSPIELERPQAIDARVKMTSASRKTSRTPNRSAIQPEAGMKTASERR